MNDCDDDLELFFEVARGAVPVPEAPLVARVLADAEAARSSPRVRWRGWVQELGGWPAMAGLSTATLAGIWIGIAPPGEVVMGGFLGLDADYVIDAGPYALTALGEDFAP